MCDRIQYQEAETAKKRHNIKEYREKKKTLIKNENNRKFICSGKEKPFFNYPVSFYLNIFIFIMFER